MKNSKFKEGFSIIEVLIVLAVIAVIASISIPSVRGILNQAKATKVVTNLRNLEVAVMQYSLLNDTTGLDLTKLEEETGFDVEDTEYTVSEADNVITLTYTSNKLAEKYYTKIDDKVEFVNENPCIKVYLK